MLSSAQTQMKGCTNQKEPGNYDPTKGNLQRSSNQPKEMEIYDLPDKEFKILILKQVDKILESTDKQLNEIKKTMYEHMMSLIKK